MWSILETIGSTAGLIVSILAAMYFVPHSPFRKWVESWIESRVSTRFEKELAQYRHQLSLEAQQVRAEHQRRLHDLTMYSEKRHEVYRELFRLLQIAHGHVADLSGAREAPSYEEFSRDEIEGLLEDFKVPGRIAAEIVNLWDDEPKAALQNLDRTMWRVDINSAKRATNEAWSYFLLNSLYLDDEVSGEAATILRKLQENIAHARYPEPGSKKKQAKLTDEVAELVELLKHRLRRHLQTGEHSSAELPAPKDTDQQD